MQIVEVDQQCSPENIINTIEESKCSSFFAPYVSFNLPVSSFDDLLNLERDIQDNEEVENNLVSRVL